MHKHTNYYFGVLAILLSSFNLSAQQLCGFDHVHQKMLEDSVYQKKHEAVSKRIAQRIELNKTANKSNEVYTIPVVVHVVYADANAPHNISDEQVISGIQRLNDIFLNSNGMSVDAKIQFQLAVRTPDCETTNGIVHVDASNLTDYATEGVDIEANDTDGKGASRIGMFNLSRWNPEEYLNIWVVNEISDNDGGAGVQAFATFPSTNYFYDGVVVLYNAFGYDYDNCDCFELKSYTDENKVIAHEIGHYFNLYHTFEGDNGGNSCPSINSSEGDKVSDTPAHKRTFYCLNGNNECYGPTDPYYDIEEVVHNYMGYATESCQFEFTQGQVERMRASLETSRNGLLGSQGCTPIGTSQPIASCVPQTTEGISGEYGMGIISVKIGNLLASSGSTYQDGGYLDNWCNSVGFEPNTEYAIDIQTYGYYTEDVRIYIDYNNNGNFENDEAIFNSNNNSNHTGNFTTPTDPMYDTPLRLRIISDHYQYNINNGCFIPNYGQVEDYSILFPAPFQEEIIDRGKSLSFDGTDDYMEINFTPDPVNEPFTYEFWCKPQGERSQGQVIFDRMPDNFSTYNFMMLWHGRFFVYMNKSLLFMNADPIEYNQWHHIAYTWDGAFQRLYLNGVLAGVDSVEVIKNNTAKLRIGSFFKNYLFFQGQIDELRTWDNARTAEQIRENMHLTKDIINEAGFIYYHFNDTLESNLINDYSKNNPATIFGNLIQAESTVNTGDDGEKQTINNIIIGQNKIAESVGLSFIFDSLETNLDFTITKQEYEANTYGGLDSLIIFSQKMWTITPSENSVFNTNIKFDFTDQIFSDLIAENYKLYHRAVGSDGNWSLLIGQAADITTSTITFSGIDQGGQFIIAKE